MTPLVSSSFNIGAFRRRAREPSILGTGRKQQQDITTTTVTQDQSTESDEEEGEEFAPDAESTPVNNRRQTRHAVQREEDDAEASPADLEEEVLNSRKRKSTVGPADESERPTKFSRSDDSASGHESDSDSSLSSLSSPQVMSGL